MAWLWSSWEEYVDTVQPVMTSEGAFRRSRTGTLLESDGRLLASLEETTNAIHCLGELGFGVTDVPFTGESALLEKAFRSVEDAVSAGEELLLCNKRLAVSEDSYGFLHQHDMLEHWDRYAQTKRIWREIQQFVEDTRELLNGYHRLARADERFIVDDLELPKALELDFRQARDLFSVGFDEVGLLVAGRGLEGVLRRIAQDRHILLELRGKIGPASEADFADLIETISQIRWEVGGAPLISRETKMMLHFLRTIRNSKAHPHLHANGPQTARETAKLVASTANHIWRSVAASRARFSSTTVQKNW